MRTGRIREDCLEKCILNREQQQGWKLGTGLRQESEEVEEKASYPVIQANYCCCTQAPVLKVLCIHRQHHGFGVPFLPTLQLVYSYGIQAHVWPGQVILALDQHRALLYTIQKFLLL